MREKKIKKIMLIVTIICVVVLLIEGIIFLFIKNEQEKSIAYYDAYQMVVPDGSNYVAVGSSDFSESDLNSYTEGIEKGKLIKLDENKKIVWEVQYDEGINSTFTSVLVLKDGYIVTGSGEYDEYQTENKIRDAFLIKYDKDGKKIWEKYYGVLSDTRFNKAIAVKDGIIVIGQSIYENMEVGNHTTGGGIIVKYDFDGNEIWHNNHGGNKSGNFNGIVEVNGDLYVVGKDAKDSGNLIKYNKNGKYEWHKNYSYTDSLGFQDIIYKNKKLYVVGSKKILQDEKDEKRDTENTDGIIVCYDLNGKVQKEVLFGGSKYERFHSIEVLNDQFYIIGVSNSTDSNLKIELEESEDKITSGFILTYDSDLKLVDSKTLGGLRNDVLTRMTKKEDKLYISGYSNSKDSNISTNKDNGKDYRGKILTADEKLNIEIIQ